MHDIVGKNLNNYSKLKLNIMPFQVLLEYISN